MIDPKPPGAPEGNTNPQKEDAPREANIHFRCTVDLKKRVHKAAGPGGATDWLIEAIEAYLPRR